MDTISKTQNEIKFTYAAFIGAWFCFVFMIQTMNRPLCSVSSWVLAALVFAAVYGDLPGCMGWNFLALS